MKPPHKNPLNKSRLVATDAKMLAMAVVAIGIGLRVYHFVLNKSLFGDESFLAINILRRGFVGLAAPLDIHQMAPLGYLVVTKLSTTFFGPSEQALRALSLLSGAASVPLMFVAARRFCSEWVALIAVSLLALSPSLIFYSVEVKQYSLELVWTLFLLLSFESFQNNPSPARVGLLASLGTLSTLFSFASVFVLGGLGVALLVAAFRRRKQSKFAAIVVLILVTWGLGFAIVYMGLLATNPNRGFMFGFWQRHFVPLDSALDFIKFWLRVVRDTLENPLGLQYSVVAIICLPIGLVAFLRKRRSLATVILISLASLVIAATIPVYPLHKRFLIFAAPLLILAIAQGLVDVRVFFTKKNKRRIGIALVVLFFSPVVFNAVYFTARPLQLGDYRQEIRPVLLELLKSRERDEEIFIHNKAASQVMYYGFLYDIDGRGKEYLFDQMNSFYFDSDDAQALTRIRNAGRSWLLFSKVSWSEIHACVRRLAPTVMADSIIGPETRIPWTPIPTSPRAYLISFSDTTTSTTIGQQ